MKILESVPVIMAPERPQEGVVYIENKPGRETLAQKIAALKEYDFDYAIFRHQDTHILTPELVEPNCCMMQEANVAVAGVIGTLIMSTTCAWWMHQRGVVTVGAIMQGDGKGGAYPMLDGPGFNPNAVSVDGAFMIFDKKFVDSYEVHDFHWRFGYDTDACFQALQQGRNVGIVDIRVQHDSQGSFDQKEFGEFQQKFLNYWKQHVDFPVIKQSIFR